MKTLFLFLFLVLIAPIRECSAMTIAEAKAVIAELKPKQNKTPDDIKSLTQALQVLAGSFTKAP